MNKHGKVIQNAGVFATFRSKPALHEHLVLCYARLQNMPEHPYYCHLARFKQLMKDYVNSKRKRRSREAGDESVKSGKHNKPAVALTHFYAMVHSASSSTCTTKQMVTDAIAAHLISEGIQFRSFESETWQVVVEKLTAYAREQKALYQTPSTGTLERNVLEVCDRTATKFGKGSTFFALCPSLRFQYGR